MEKNFAFPQQHNNVLQHLTTMLAHPTLTLARGARQLVVHDALETTVILLESYLSWLTPMTSMGASAEGAEMTTFLAPAFRWAWHCSSSSSSKHAIRRG
jgi:hypothetical protein